MRVGWVVQSNNFDLASVRYRCHYPAYGMSLAGVESAIFDDPAEATRALPELDVLIIVKRLDMAMIALAAKAREAQLPVVFDLCDDVISPGYRGDAPELHLMVLAAIGSVADLIVTTGPALSDRVRNSLPLWTPVIGIPDVVETPQLVEATRRFLGAEAMQARAQDDPPRVGEGAVRLQEWRYWSRHPVRAAFRIAGTIRRHRLTVKAAQRSGRLLYVLRKPGWLAMRVQRSWRRGARWVPVRVFLGRARYWATHPRWAARKVAGAAGATPGLRGLRIGFGRALYRVRRPVWTLRKLRHGVLTSKPARAARTALGRTAHVVIHPGWAVRKARRAVVRSSPAVALRMRAGRAVYALKRPRWLVAKTAHRMASAPATVALRTTLRRAAYSAARPGRLAHKLGRSAARSRAVVGVRTQAGRALWLLARPERAAARMANALYGVRLFRVAARPFRGLVRAALRAPPAGHAATPPAAGPATAAQEHAAPEAAPPKKVVWFGNHGGPHSNFGLLSLLAVAEPLRRVCAEHPFELVIISNGRRKFEAALTRLGVPVRYVSWSSDAVYHELAGSDAALLTTGDDRFSRVKSANRAVLALAAGVPVVAPAAPGLAPLQGCLQTDVEKGLRRYLRDPLARTADLAKARPAIEQAFGLSAVCRQWEQALADVSARGRARRQRRAQRPKLLFLIDLIQDLDILAPVIDAARRRDLICNVIVSEQAASESPRVIQALIDRKIIPTMIDKSAVQRLDARWLRDCDVLVTAAETSLPPHRIAHALTKLANGLRIRTASVQHGYESPGITYFPGQQVQIASQAMFIWRDAADLPPSTPEDVRRRCIGVGRASHVRHYFGRNGPPPPGRAVGVFENLHWERYSNDYRRAFIDQLEAVIEDRPDLTFVVRPHPAGRWFLEKGPAMRQPNVTVMGANGESPDATPIGQLLGDLLAVVTTPSTVALDGCEVGRPTAVVQGDLGDLPLYAPLPLLRTDSDWLDFLAMAEAGGGVEICRDFLQRASLPYDGAERIIDHLCDGASPCSVIPPRDRAVAAEGPVAAQPTAPAA